MNEKNIIHIKLSIEVAKLQLPCQLYLESVQILEAYTLGMSKVLNHFFCDGKINKAHHKKNKMKTEGMHN